jgi:hypothetical protein
MEKVAAVATVSAVAGGYMLYNESKRRQVEAEERNRQDVAGRARQEQAEFLRKIAEAEQVRLGSGPLNRTADEMLFTVLRRREQDSLMWNLLMNIRTKLNVQNNANQNNSAPEIYENGSKTVPQLLTMPLFHVTDSVINVNAVLSMVLCLFGVDNDSFKKLFFNEKLMPAVARTGDVHGENSDCELSKFLPDFHSLYSLNAYTDSLNYSYFRKV